MHELPGDSVSLIRLARTDREMAHKAIRSLYKDLQLTHGDIDKCYPHRLEVTSLYYIASSDTMLVLDWSLFTRNGKRLGDDDKSPLRHHERLARSHQEWQAL